MMDDRRAVLVDPFATQAVQTIAAFASLHVAIAMTTCLMAELLGLPRCVRVAAWVFLALTVLATIYLGWHFFVDTIAGAAVGSRRGLDRGVGHRQPGRAAGRGSPPTRSPTRTSPTSRERTSGSAPRSRRSPRRRRTSCAARRSRAARRPSCAGRRAGAGAATDWLTVLLIATNEPCAPSASFTAVASRWAAARNPSRSSAGRSGSVSTCSAGHQQDVALEHRPDVEERHEVVVLEDDIGLRVGLPCRDRAEQAAGHTAEPSGRAGWRGPRWWCAARQRRWPSRVRPGRPGPRTW